MADGRSKQTLKTRSSWPVLLKHRFSGKHRSEGDETDTLVPALPPRPASIDETISSVKEDEKKQSLSELAECYSDKLPVSIKVVSGLRRKTSENEFLTVERISCPELVTCCYNGQRFSVPLSVNLKFAILWEQEQAADDFEVLAGKEFTAGTLLQCNSNAPKIVSVKQDWESDEVCVQAGEVLVVETRTADTTRKIKVFSLTTRSGKTLPLDCPVIFTNRAQDISLHLPDIVAYVANLFPCRACILRYDFGPKCYPANIVTLEGVGRVRVLTCRSSVGEQPVAFNVPVDLPGVEVTLFDDKTTLHYSGNGEGREARAASIESTGSESHITSARCTSPVYETLLLRDEVARHPANTHVSAIGSDNVVATAGASDAAEHTAVARPPSPVYEKLCVTPLQNPVNQSVPDEGYVTMTGAANVPAVRPERVSTTSEYEEMKALVENCEGNSSTKKLSVVYVNTT